MRRLLVTSLLLIVGACDGSSSTRSDASTISVRVLDDRGVPVNRMPVVARLSASASVSTRTGKDGTAEIHVGDPGLYTVSVIPRDGYFKGLDPLTKSVSVASNAVAAVDFTVYRAGVTTDQPLPREW